MKNYVKTNIYLDLSFCSRNFLLAGCQGCPSSPNAQLTENRPKKPKKYLPLKIYVKTYKNLHLSFSGRNFFVGRLLGLPYQPKRSFIVQKYFEKSKNAKIWFLNYKNLSLVVRPIKSKIFEIAWQNGPKVHSAHFGPARAANSIFRGFFTSSTFFGND